MRPVLGGGPGTTEMAKQPGHIYAGNSLQTLIARLRKAERAIAIMSTSQVSRTPDERYKARRKAQYAEKLRVAIRAKAKLHLIEVQRAEDALRSPISKPAKQRRPQQTNGQEVHP